MKKRVLYAFCSLFFGIVGAISLSHNASATQYNLDHPIVFHYGTGSGPLPQPSCTSLSTFSVGPGHLMFRSAMENSHHYHCLSFVDAAVMFGTTIQPPPSGFLRITFRLNFEGSHNGAIACQASDLRFFNRCLTEGSPTNSVVPYTIDFPGNAIGSTFWLNGTSPVSALRTGFSITGTELQPGLSQYSFYGVLETETPLSSLSMATNYQKIFSKQGGYIANWDVYWSGGVVNVEQVSSNGDVLGRLDIISDQLSSIESSIQDTNDLLREAEENRQREREEEQQMGDDAADGGNGIFSLLSGLSILNPFGAFFDFTDGCRDISGLGNFLSLSPENHTICPFFPASVRNVVSPIVGVFTIVLVFTFAWSILGADSSKMSKV